MPSRVRRSSKAPNLKQNTTQIKILSRPSSAKGSVQSTPDLSEFETPSKVSNPDPLRQISTNGALPSADRSNNTAGTPSRPQSMPVRNSYNGSRSMASASESITNNSASVTPSQTPKKGYSPLQRQSRSPPKPHTPLMKSLTPSQYYAGPAFHASPAASALPMPKFLSRSVPNLTKSPSLQSMMEKEGGNMESDQSDDSPSLRKSRIVEENKISEESDQDGLISTNTSEKFEQQKENQITTTADESNIESPSTDDSKPASTLTRTEDQKPYHARHGTESSIGEFFPLEIGHLSPPNNSKVESSPQPSALCLTPPISLSEEQRKDKSLELKRLLLSSKFQCSSSTALGLETELNRKPPSLLFSRTNSLQDSFSPGSAPNTTRTYTPQKLQQRAVSSSATSPTTWSFQPQSKSSNLRKQSKLPGLSDYSHLPELPPSPTPIYWYGSGKPYAQRNKNSRKDSVKSFTSEFSSQSSSHSIESDLTQNAEQTRSIESYLRSVLKLDMHSRTGSNEIQT